MSTAVFGNEPRIDSSLLRVYQNRNFRERHRERDNWRIYDGTDYGQWNEQSVRLAIQEGRPLSSFNFTKKTTDTIVGSLIADPYDLRYDTELGDQDEHSLLFNELYLEDKDSGGYDIQYHDFLRAGFVYKGFLRFFKDRRWDRRGRVGIQYVRGDMVIIDPDHSSNDLNDCKNIFVTAWMSAQQIADKYNKKTEEIKEAIKIYEQKKSGGAITESQYDEGEEAQLFDRSPEVVDQKYGLFLVIDRYTLIKKEYYDLFDMVSGDVVATRPSDEAKVLAKAFNRQGMKIRLLPKNFKECHLRTTCPGLSLKLVLQDAPYEYQLNGYPFLDFSCDMVNGRPNTFVDILKDAQISFNKRENTATHILMTSANNALMIESDAVEDEADVDKIGKQRNRPGAYFKVAPGAIGQRKIQHLDHGNTPHDFLNSGSHIREIMQELTPGVPATQSIDEGRQSGVLFQSKIQQAMVAMQIPNRFIRVFWEKFGNYYFLAAKQTYTYPMHIRSSREGTEYYLNIEGGIDIQSIGRLKINVSQSPNSETHRRNLLQSYLAIAQYLQDPLTLSSLSRIVVGSMPGLPEREQDQLRESARLSEEVQKLNLQLQVMQIKAAMQGGGAPQQEGQAKGGAPLAAPQGIDSQQLLSGILQNVQNNKRGLPSPTGA